MNWNRILNIMILIFLIMNVGIFIYSRSGSEDDYILSSERVDQLNEVLSEHGVTMYNFYPSYKPMVSFAVTAASYDRTAILNRIFDGNSYNIEKGIAEDRIYESYEYGDELLTFFSGNHSGQIHYEGPSHFYQLSNYQLSDVVDLGSAFSEDLIGAYIPLLLVSVYYDEELDQYHLLFNEAESDNVLFCNYVKLIVGSEGVLSADASIYPKVEVMGNEQDIYPIDEVLYKWVDTIKVEGETLAIIKKIELGYHLGIDELNKDASIEVVPHYRIVMHDGEIYDINAYTNELRVE